jgi:RimJ/RimL family protein N-acetyltransferase
VGEIRLRLFTTEALSVLEPWFDDPETQRRLGGPDWPARELRLLADPPPAHRGQRVERRWAWVAEDLVPVGLVVAEAYCDATASVALVVDPARRGRGVGRRILRAVLDALRAAGIREATGGIEADNVASVRCVEAAGFTRQAEEPDAEGFVNFAATT